MTSTNGLTLERLEQWARMAMWPAIATVLLAPLIVMQFTREVNWTAFDFAFAGALLVGAGVAYEVGRRLVRKPLHRALVGAGLAIVVLAIWADGTVGII